MAKNMITISGNLCSDPEAIGTSGMVKARMAIGEDKNKDGERYTTFADLVCFKQNGEFLKEYGRKGSAVTVFGRLNNRQYQNKDGNTGYSLEIKATDITIPKPPGASAGGGGGAAVGADDLAF